LTSGDASSCITWLAGAMNSFDRKYTMHAGAERPGPSGLCFGRHTCFFWIPACFNSRFLKRWTLLFWLFLKLGGHHCPSCQMYSHSSSSWSNHLWSACLFLGWSTTSFIFRRRPSLGCILPILSWTDRRFTVSCLYSEYLSLHSGQFLNVGSFKPSFQQCLKNAHPQCARSCSRACSSSSLLRASSSDLRLSSSYFCF
jgi:hypothetical protein